MGTEGEIYRNSSIRNSPIAVSEQIMLEQIDAFVFIFDMQEQKPVWINEHARKRMGYGDVDLNSFSPMDFIRLFHPDSIRLLQSRIGHYNTEIQGEKNIYKLRTQSGEWLHMLTSTKAYAYNADGSVKVLVGFGVEVNPHELDHGIRQIQQLNRTTRGAITRLSRREYEITELIVRGYTDKEISDELGISIHTTKTHRKRIISKLGLKNTASLVRFAVENGIG